MNELSKQTGQRIRHYRTNAGLNQEKLAEISGCHATYIGQIGMAKKTQH